MFDWRAIGIRNPGRRLGDFKTHCPECRNNRSHPNDKSLSCNAEEGIFHCHYCGWKGKAPTYDQQTVTKFLRGEQMQKRKTYSKPKYESQPNPEDKLIHWFAGRGISEATVRRNRIEVRNVWFSEKEPEVRAIAFPYFRGGEVVNIQYRTADKRFKLEKGCELILYGLDDVKPDEPLIFVEGQLDKLSLEEAGYTNCVSLPNGANNINGEWLESAKEQLDSAKYFILAGDNDHPGRLCQEELARRLGLEKCWRAEWPEGCKDANDTLMLHGKAEVINAIECAQPLPLNGIVEIHDLLPEIESLYKEGLQGGVSTGWQTLDEYYRPRLGEFSVITGSPGTGKSTFLDALLLNLAMLHNWTFAVFSPEQEPLAHHASNLLRLFKGKPFQQGPSDRMSWEDAADGVARLTDHFKFLSPEEDDLTVEGIIRLTKACITRYGIQGLVIDPWNELEHTRPARMSETEFIGDALRKLRHFARLHKIHLWVMVHPTKLKKEIDGKYPVPTPYDLNGSANWYNKADMILSLWRDKAKDDAPVEIHSQKVRFIENGKIGRADLWWDRITARFSEDRFNFFQQWEQD